MSRLKTLFETKRKRILNVYCTAGYPHLESTLPVMKALQDNGTDIIELGIPYSDPLADGPVIQASSAQALANGMTLETLFAQLQNFRQQIFVPVILMGNLNPVLQYGFEKFCKHAADLPVDGIILPDLPEYEFEKHYKPILQRFGLDFIFLVTPETSEERIQMLDRLSTGFLYAVSSSSTTGKQKDFSSVEDYLIRLQKLHLTNPVMVGFGIKDKESFDLVCNYANGGIIGSAYIKALHEGNDIELTTAGFLKSISAG